MKKNTAERAEDVVGKPKLIQTTEGSSAGTAKNLSKGGSTKGVGALRAANTVDEPVKHEPAYRRGVEGDKNYDKKVISGMPQTQAGYQNRDRQGAGLETQPKWQVKQASYPKGNRGMSDKTKTLN